MLSKKNCITSMNSDTTMTLMPLIFPHYNTELLFVCKSCSPLNNSSKILFAKNEGNGILFEKLSNSLCHIVAADILK